MAEQLTERQAEVYAVVLARSGLRGPTMREVGKELGITTPNGVLCHFHALEKKGFLRRIPTGDGHSGYYVPTEQGIPTIWGVVS